MSNFNSVISANETAINSAGSAARENSTYMEGLEAKISALKQSFQELSNALLGEDLVGIVLDLSKSFLDLVNTDVGRILAIASAITVLSIAIMGLWKAVGAGKAFLAAFSTGTTLAAGGLAAINWPLIIFIGSLTALVALAPKIKDFFETINSSVPELNEKLSDTETQIENNKQRIQEINQMSWNDKSSEILNERDALQAENEELEKQIEKLEKLKQKRIEQATNRQGVVYSGQTYATPNLQVARQAKEFNSYNEALDALVDRYGEAVVEAENLKDAIYEVGTVLKGEELDQGLSSVLSQLSNELKTTNKLEEESIVLRDKNISLIEEQVSAYQEIPYEQLTASQKQFLDAYNNYNNALQESINRIPNLVNELVKEANQAAKTGENIYDLAAKSLIFNKTSLNVSDKIAALAELGQQAGATAASIAAVMGIQSKDFNKTVSGLMETQHLTQAQATQKAYQSIYDAMSKTAQTPNVNPLGTSSGGSKSTKQATDKALTAFQGYYKDIQHLREMNEISEEEYLTRLAVLVQNYTADATAHMKAYGTNAKEITRNMYQYEEEIASKRKALKEQEIKDAEEAAQKAQEAYEKALDEQKTLYETFFSYMSDQIDKEISKLQDEYSEIEKYWDDKITALQNQNTALEEQITLEEKLQALTKADNEQLMVYKDGRFQYVKNIDEISKAQSDLDSYKREQALKEETANLERLKEEALKSIQDQIDGWEKYKEEWSSVVDTYQKEQDRLMLEQKLGISLEGENWKLRLSNLQEYANQYQSILNGIVNAQVATNQALQTGTIVNSKSYGGYGSIEEMNKALARGETVGDDGLSYNDDTYYGVDKDKVDSTPSGKGTGNGPSASDIWNNTPGWDLVGFANGTVNAPEGISLVGEQGPELHVTKNGDGIIPSNITKNLLEMGKNPYSFGGNYPKVSSVTGGNSSYSFSISNLSLPNATDANSLVNGLRNYAMQRVSKRV